MVLSRDSEDKKFVSMSRKTSRILALSPPTAGLEYHKRNSY